MKAPVAGCTVAVGRTAAAATIAAIAIAGLGLGQAWKQLAQRL